jgi:hypothetical protein
VNICINKWSIHWQVAGSLIFYAGYHYLNRTWRERVTGIPIRGRITFFQVNGTAWISKNLCKNCFYFYLFRKWSVLFNRRKGSNKCIKSIKLHVYRFITEGRQNHRHLGFGAQNAFKIQIKCIFVNPSTCTNHIHQKNLI